MLEVHIGKENNQKIKKQKLLCKIFIDRPDNGIGKARIANKILSHFLKL